MFDVSHVLLLKSKHCFSFFDRISCLVIEVAEDDDRLKVLNDKFQQSLIAWMPLEGRLFSGQNYT